VSERHAESEEVLGEQGAPVGDLTPPRRSRFVRSGDVVAVFAAAPSIDADRLRRDLDAVVCPQARERDAANADAAPRVAST
jgi:hypothetical protein